VRRLQSEDLGLEVIHPHAAGIDVGNSAHYVAVRPERDPQPVRRFECFTADLHRLADWLQSCGVKTVAASSVVQQQLQEFHCFICLTLCADCRCGTNSLRAVRSKIATPPITQPTLKEWFGPVVQEIVKSR